MSNEIYPTTSAAGPVRGLGFTVVKRPGFNTLLQRAPNEFEYRLAQTRNPIWKWTLIYDVLSDDSNNINVGAGLAYTDLRTLIGFYLARSGRYDDFLFWDPDDNYMGPALSGGSPNTQAQLSVVNDGVTYYSPLQRNLGGFMEDVTDLKSGTLAVYANGVLKSTPTDYTVAGPGLSVSGSSYMGKYIQWVSAPTAPVTVQFNFYFRVRFDSDEQDFEKFVNNLWAIGGPEGKGGTGTLSLISARPAIL